MDEEDKDAIEEGYPSKFRRSAEQSWQRHPKFQPASQRKGGGALTLKAIY